VHRNRVAGNASCIGCARASMLLKPSRARDVKSVSALQEFLWVERSRRVGCRLSPL
jgi:hypothetical protein